MSLTCKRCGRAISGAYVEALGETWHPLHLVCAICHRPFSDSTFYAKDDLPYCRADFERLFRPRCTVCSQPLTDRYHENGWGEQYCASHATLPSCFCCHRPVILPAGGVSYADRRVVCTVCRTSAIDREDQANSIFRDVRQVLSRRGLALGLAATPVRLVDRVEIAAQAGVPQDRAPLGLTRLHTWTRHTTGSSADANTARVVGRKTDEILVLHGLSAEHFSMVSAHEIGHAWILMTALPNVDISVQEGLCELAASFWLEERDSREARYYLRLKEQNRDPVYGEGYRHARRAYEVLGFEALVESVRRRRDWPVLPRQSLSPPPRP